MGLIRKLTSCSEDGSSASKAAVYYFAGQVISRGLAFLGTAIFARLMTKAEFGSVSNILALQVVLYPLLTLNVTSTINKARYDFPDDKDQYLLSSILISAVSVGLASIFFELNRDTVCSLVSMDAIYVRIVLLYIFFYNIFDLKLIQYNIYKKPKAFVLASTFLSLLSLLLSVVLVVFLQNKVVGRMIGILVPPVCSGLIILFSILKKGPRIKTEYLKYALLLALPLIPASLSGELLTSSDKLIITYFCGDSQTALYSIPYTVASIAAIVWVALNRVWSPIFLDGLNNRDFPKIKRMGRTIGGIYMIPICGLMLLAPDILYIIGGEKYMDSLYVIPPVILGMVCQFYYAFYYNAEYFYGETFLISIGTLLAGITNVILNVLLIPLYGYIAAAYTTLISYVLMLIYHYLIVRFKVKKAFVFDNRAFAIQIAFLVGFQLLSVIAYSLFELRIILIVAYFAVVVFFVCKYKNLLMSLLR